MLAGCIHSAEVVKSKWPRQQVKTTTRREIILPFEFPILFVIIEGMFQTKYRTCSLLVCGYYFDNRVPPLSTFSTVLSALRSRVQCETNQDSSVRGRTHRTCP